MATENCELCSGLKRCPVCKGKGKLIKPQVDGLGTAYRSVPCEGCLGTGKCPLCQTVEAPLAN